ncbi:IclR family transcriptional regulator [Streptacidiphilus jiangxiensis]|uniref:Glycerol operon regulatory protein n=1 Tax=Streptacidiphilus jiangxiensis TaxID=235985 RepID=A0A1H8AQ74_STRJI|nr:IclR family transcriptional regulator [Streptacidiphilus jiangxiensis]SEM71939.1 DNA-binding transcriptional regulator, IclR family [Streptacidiphilus jiangxiensis]
MSNGVQPGESPVQSVDRAVTILELLAARGEAGVTEIAAELGVHKSTAFRLVAALELRGLVEQPGERGKYRLGLGLVRLAGAATVRLDLSQQSRPVCERLAIEVAETINVAILDVDAAVNIEQVLGPSAITTHNWVGQRTPLHATSSGKVLLAYLPEPALTARLAAPLERFTPQTVTDAARLRRQLDAARKDGFACTVEELETGLNAVAAPVFAHNGQVVAAISASGPSFRLAKPRLAEVATAVREAAEEVSTRLGYVRTRA